MDLAPRSLPDRFEAARRRKARLRKKEEAAQRRAQKKELERADRAAEKREKKRAAKAKEIAAEVAIGVELEAKIHDAEDREADAVALEALGTIEDDTRKAAVEKAMKKKQEQLAKAKKLLKEIEAKERPRRRQTSARLLAAIADRVS